MHLPNSEAYKINWQAPWLLHLPSEMRAIAQAQDMKASLNAHVSGLYTGNHMPLCFIAQEELPEGEAYESHIFKTGCVPTRLNLHDFFNAGVWLTFPQTKAVLNARQAAQIQQLGIQHARGVARDALTLFDENAAILVTSNPGVGRALRQFDWQDALVQTRALWDNSLQPNVNAQAVVYAFGHALMEKLTNPYKAICAHTWIVEVEPAWFVLSLHNRLRDLDFRLAQQLSSIELNTRDFCPLPILGVPHFWTDNRNESFYNDARVFRNGRTRLMSHS